MKIARDLERRLERLVEGITAALFPGSAHPVELANRLVREADLAVVEGPAGPTAPNVFVLRLGPDELDESIDPDGLAEELSAVVESTARSRGWRLEGPCRVRIRLDGGSSHAGIVEVAVQPGRLAPWGYLIDANGRAHQLCHNREIVGRGTDCDVTLAVPEVSRSHALVWREADAVWVADLDSANGVRVNGEPIRRPVAVRPGDRLTFGPVTLGYTAA